MDHFVFLIPSSDRAPKRYRYSPTGILEISREEHFPEMQSLSLDIIVPSRRRAVDVTGVSGETDPQCVPGLHCAALRDEKRAQEFHQRVARREQGQVRGDRGKRKRGKESTEETSGTRRARVDQGKSLSIVIGTEGIRVVAALFLHVWTRVGVTAVETWDLKCLSAISISLIYARNIPGNARLPARRRWSLSLSPRCYLSFIL